MSTPTTPEEYLASLAPEIRPAVESVRAALREALPDAQEKVRYGIVAFMLGGRYAVHYAGWKSHIGLYPIPTGLPDDIETRIAPYRAEKDSVRFRYKDPIPLELITETAAAIAALRASAD